MCDRRNVRRVNPAADAPADAPVPPVSVLADTVLKRLVAAYAPAADPVRAEGAAAYMKHVAPFLGIPTAERRALSRTVLAGTRRPDERDCTAIALRCWLLPEREYHYFAVDYLRRHAGRCTSGFLPVLHHLVTTVPWWDTVDLLAAHVAGPLVAADPALAREMDRWIDDPSLWAARTALLHQLRYQEATDADRLKAEIGYKKLAMGEVTATATLGRPIADVVAELDAGQRPEFPVAIEITRADGAVTGEMTVVWTLRPNG
ncbi:hypothetical protein SBADM41S_07609 [Streptomyces badius]